MKLDMGSDLGKRRHIDSFTILGKNTIGLARLLAAFLLGYFLSAYDVPSLSKIGSDCIISFGDVKYRGPQYFSEVTVGSPKCLVESKFLKVQQHSVRFEGQSDIIEDWLWIDYYDRINVLIEVSEPKKDHEPKFLVFEQTKYALEGRTSLAIVGGIIEPGESPESAAFREVLEETSNRCAKLHFLGRYRTDVNRGMGWTNSFIASQCERADAFVDEDVKGQQVGASDSERQDVKILSLADVQEAALDGKFLEIQWSATVALAMLYYEKHLKER
jgi:8-oxo-dGTP pyrophosphatase MutT (NUDIX family)